MPARYRLIKKIAEENDLFLVEDAAQSFGANINNVKSGKFGDVSCTSFFPAKPLGCYGDGGAIFTDDEDLAEIIKSIRVHGSNGNDKYNNVRVGINGRLDTIQAAIGENSTHASLEVLKSKEIVKHSVIPSPAAIKAFMRARI